MMAGGSTVRSGRAGKPSAGNAAPWATTDERGTPDGVGRYNHFTGGDGGSIYWTPGTGAWSVHGAIRTRWKNMGWERSCLGYPTSDEHALPGGRANTFQRGYITWNPHTGATSSCR